MLVDALRPDLLAAERVQRIGIGALVAEVDRKSARALSNADGGAHRCFRAELPVHAATPCIEGVDLGAGAADKEHATQHRGLAVSADNAGKAEGPLEFQLRHFGGAQTRHLGTLEAVLLDPIAPAIPMRPGEGAIQR